MHKPRRGKENYEAGVALCEDILRMMLKHQPGEDGTAIMLTALALVNSYIMEGICYTSAFEVGGQVKLIECYNKLFESDWWMGPREDAIQFQIEDFINGKRIPMRNALHINDNELNELL